MVCCQCEIVVSGFASKEDAEIVAGIFVKMIKNGDLTPKINDQILYSLRINTKMK